MGASEKQVRSVLESHEQRLAKLPNVVGLGIQEDPDSTKTGSFVLAVYVSRRVPESDLDARHVVPKQISLGPNTKQHVRTHVIESGPFSFRNSKVAKSKPTKKKSKKSRPATKTTASPTVRRGGRGSGTNDTPSDTPAVRPTCDALIVQVGQPGMPEDEALALATEVAGTLRGKWEITPFAPGSDAFEFRRAGSRKDIKVSTAWGYAHDLKAHRDVRSAEPSLILPGHDLPLEWVADYLTPQESMAAQSRLKGDKPKACAKNDFEWSIKLCEIDKARTLPLPAGGKHDGAGIVIGHPDTGYTKHAQYWGSNGSRVLVAKGYDFDGDDSDPVDDLDQGFNKQPGHGTATGSVIMSAKDPAGPSGVTGVATKAKLIPIRVTNTVVLFGFGRLAKAIYLAVNSGAHVISISLGGPFKSKTLQQAMQYAIDRGVVVFAAAGNVWPWVVYPARLPEVIAVGACDCERKPWKKTARGDAVDLSAPGAAVWRAGTEEDGSASVGMGHGTSFAVATTAGACALWLAFHGRRALIRKYGHRNIAPVFKDILLREGVDVPPRWKKDKDGEGVLNVLKLLSAPLPDRAPAGGMGGFSTQADTPADELLSYFPDDDPNRVMDATLALLGADHRSFGAMMAAVGDELTYLVASTPSLRSSIQAKARSATKITKQSMRREAARGDGKAVLQAQASRQLRKVMGV